MSFYLYYGCQYKPAKNVLLTSLTDSPSLNALSLSLLGQLGKNHCNTFHLPTALQTLFQGSPL